MRAERGPAGASEPRAPTASEGWNPPGSAPNSPSHIEIVTNSLQRENLRSISRSRWRKAFHTISVIVAVNQREGLVLDWSIWKSKVWSHLSLHVPVLGRRILHLTLYTLVGCVVYARLEGWSWGTTVYFLCTTTSTVGYGDVAPRSQSGRFFTALYAIAGITEVFTTIAAAIRPLLNLMHRFQRGMLRVLGVAEHSEAEIDIAVSPEEVRKMRSDVKLVALALCPCLLVLVLGTVIGWFVLQQGTLTDSFYWCVLTATTVGYGDVKLRETPAARAAICVLVMVSVTAITDAILEVSTILTHKRISKHSYVGSLEDMVMGDELLHLAENTGAMGQVREADFLVAALVNTGLVDRKVIMALRRQFHYASNAARDSSKVETLDIFDLKKRSGQLRAYGNSARPIDCSGPDGGYQAWIAAYWTPRKKRIIKAMAKKAEGQRKKTRATLKDKLHEAGEDSLGLATDSAVTFTHAWRRQRLRLFKSRAQKAIHLTRWVSSDDKPEGLTDLSSPVSPATNGESAGEHSDGAGGSPRPSLDASTVEETIELPDTSEVPETRFGHLRQDSYVDGANAEYEIDLNMVEDFARGWQCESYAETPFGRKVGTVGDTAAEALSSDEQPRPHKKSLSQGPSLARTVTFSHTQIDRQTAKLMHSRSHAHGWYVGGDADAS